MEACPPSRRYRVGKFIRKHRAGVITAVALSAAALALIASIGYVLRDRADRLANIEQKVEVALAGARTAIEAGDLALASQRLGEAQGHLGTEREHLSARAADIDRVLTEIEGRRSDEHRLRQFLKLASDVQDNMIGSWNVGNLLAKETLDLYGVLTADNWLTRLDNSYLTSSQKKQIKEMAYVTLVSWANVCVEWPEPKQFDLSPFLLQRAEAFHEPTRAFYFVRSKYHKRCKNAAEAEEDVKRFQAAPARTAWDYYLPAAQAEDVNEAIRSYQAALRLQPDHFYSLTFLAMRFQAPAINRVPEAIWLFTACIALRPGPGSIHSYMLRASCYERLGQLAEAQADYRAAVAAATDAFAADPKLANEDNPHRYRAACAAALAGCARGKDAAELKAEEYARLRGQALDWLRAELAACRLKLDENRKKHRIMEVRDRIIEVTAKTRIWQLDEDFNGVRGEEALARLPEAERQEWRKLWEDVEALAQQAFVVRSAKDE